MHLRNKLNVKILASLVEPGVYSDGGGLYVKIRKTGSRSWMYVWMANGKRHEMGLGSLYDVTLAQARDLALDARRTVLAGRNPIEDRKRAKLKTHVSITFGDFAEKLMDDIEAGFRNEKHRKQWRSTIQHHAKPLLSKAIVDIETEDVLGVLKPIWLEKPETASRLRGRIERVLDAARVKGLRDGENPARWRGHMELLLPRKAQRQIKHHAALPFAEMAVFMPKLRLREATAARALEFAILTAARSGEVIGMTWGEVDFDAKVWTVPAARMKAGAEHQVPLSDASLIILSSIKPAVFQPEALVFAGDRGKAMSNMAMSMLFPVITYGPDLRL